MYFSADPKTSQYKTSKVLTRDIAQLTDIEKASIFALFITTRSAHFGQNLRKLQLKHSKAEAETSKKAKSK